MRCPECTQRNSVAARNCKFCGQKFKKAGPVIPIKAVVGVGAVALTIGLGAAVTSLFSKPEVKLLPVAERMAAGPKNAEDAQLMRVQLDEAVVKYLEQNGGHSSSDLLTKLQSQLPTSAFEVLVFDLPNQVKLVEVDCVLHPSDYLVVPTKTTPKVAKISNLSVFDGAKLIESTPENCLVLLGHTTGDGPRQPQIKTVALMPSGEVSDRSDTLVPVIKGSGTASFVGTSSDIKIERTLTSTAKDLKLFSGNIPFKDEPFITTLSWKKGRYNASGSLGSGELGALYAVASSLVTADASEQFRTYLSTEVRDKIKELEAKPIAPPGSFEIKKASKDAPPKRRRSRRNRDADAGGSSTYLLVSGARAFEVGLIKSGRWSATSLKEVAAPEKSESVASQPETQEAPSVAPAVVKQEVVESPDSKIVVKGGENKPEKVAVAEPKQPVVETKPEPEVKKEKRSERERRAQREEPAPTPTPVKASGTIVTETSSRVTMRTGPGRKYKSIFDVSRGAPVKVLAEQDGWYKISVNGREGYVYSGYVNKGSRSEKPAPAVASKEKPSRRERSEKVTVSSVQKNNKNSKYRSQISSGKAHGIDRGSSVDAPDEPAFVP